MAPGKQHTQTYGSRYCGHIQQRCRVLAAFASEAQPLARVHIQLRGHFQCQGSKAVRVSASQRERERGGAMRYDSVSE